MNAHYFTKDQMDISHATDFFKTISFQKQGLRNLLI